MIPCLGLFFINQTFKEQSKTFLLALYEEEIMAPIGQFLTQNIPQSLL